MALKRAGVAGYTCVVCLLLVLLVTACGPPGNPPLGSKPTVPPNAGPVTASNGETPEEAAVRLFPAAYARELALGASPQELTGSEPGRPTPMSADYVYDANIVRWLLPDDAKAVSGNMFAAMWPSAMAKDAFFVPFIKRGRVIGQYCVALQKGDVWLYVDSLTSSLRRGQLYELQTSTDKLKALLGEDTVVRPAVFLPSGLAFAVGDNQGREAAVMIGYSDRGPGVDGYANGREVPAMGRLFTLDQLKTLLAGK